ncbi:hypothetical protein ACFOD4_08280 [Pseudoroseomonas globiformis]|uniref:DUF5872 domain-containing protein n=1 Tax=Teichococcus globiformis TaxID=2307229 RepID=A0ABV7FXZ3_9PROT
MAATAKKTDPTLWERVKHRVTEGDKGGKSGQWSARKAQLATSEYKKAGGGYRGSKGSDNHLQQWTEEEWGTKSGQKSGHTGERYLPKKAREKLSDSEYSRSTAKKRADTKKGKQFSAQPKDVARKAASTRRTDGRSGGGTTKQALMQEARKRNIPGRSRMDKAALAKALGHKA